jgi:hypothetical protein
VVVRCWCGAGALLVRCWCAAGALLVALLVRCWCVAGALLVREGAGVSVVIAGISVCVCVCDLQMLLLGLANFVRTWSAWIKLLLYSNYECFFDVELVFERKKLT